MSDLRGTSESSVLDGVFFGDAAEEEDYVAQGRKL